MSTKTFSKEQQDSLKSIAAFLREYRLQSGLTQEDLAEYADVHRNTIIRLEAGCNVSIINFITIALAMEIPLREVFYDFY